MQPGDGTVSIAETARKLRVGLAYAYSLIWSGKLPGEKKQGRWEVPISAIEEYIRGKDRDYAR